MKIWRSLSLLLVLIGGLIFGAGPALAITQLNVTTVDYQQCPAELNSGAVTSGGSSRPATCYLVVGTLNNPSNKTVYDVDIYGRVYDANGDSVMQNRTRLGEVEEVPPGDHPFEIRISVPASQPEPLQLKQFKASGFSATVRTQLLEEPAESRF
ncbi:hypothetical protein [Synechococcus elongatus]|uniref:Biotin carboxylase n=2 Tax=Synechococcus elongatus TaxID=32046 RepID=Q31N88_SYNE7|nr:hypothetical protein [Synechococcus elongatus]ABB57481.1 conserved hypothetical protein [Synechococcus elongatus PCC 7942 = FACHB-805]MBD2588485.1 hypothetical protein [Synechococcus elongatus FACHB-242]MBD2689553.1 hypothetical protein [Synechococcus elongatus FACHB-1061]MBD2708028.1 hypothetical protein [Synechococcus elongatus PCC 7942 = FACHB-805]UOW71266.1 hypothetical protein PCC7943_1517 [Synechococcus elongatus PCC 7943]